MGKRLAATMLVVAGIGLMGCSEKETDTAKTQIPKENTDEITVFDINSGDWQFDDRIAQEIMARTGVKITVIDPTDDPSEKVDLMLAYRDYPDMILISLSDIGRYQDAGVLLDLEPYLDQAPNVESMYGDMLNRLRTEDGKLYYLSNWYGKDEDAVSGFHIRYDYMVEVAGKERADSNEPFTQEEFLELLRIFKEKYPVIDGQESIPFTTSINLNSSAALQGMYGLKTYYEKDGNLQYLVRDPNYLEMILFLNQMYREGLMDKEWVVNRRALFNEKLIEGRVFATACAYWDLDDDNGVLRQDGGNETCFYGYKVLGKGIDETQTTYSGRNSIGWDAIALTDNCRNPEAAIRVMNFLASEEGQYLMLWGIEGEDWDYVDGVRTPRAEILESLDSVVNEAVDRTSIRKWRWFIKNGLGSDGSPYDMMTKYQPSDEAIVINQRMKYDYWDISLYSGLEPESGTQEALMWKNIEDIYDKAYPRMVNAASQEEAIRLYEKMIQDMEAEGLKKVEAVISENYRQRLELWGE
ncbi:MAG: extracellular solute-binding protein [Lachnospiraceae bacterium]|nr:extracellular solute-binding protein [Lachnospiraceae bacterium]